MCSSKYNVVPVSVPINISSDLPIFGLMAKNDGSTNLASYDQIFHLKLVGVRIPREIGDILDIAAEAKGETAAGYGRRAIIAALEKDHSDEVREALKKIMEDELHDGTSNITAIEGLDGKDGLPIEGLESGAVDDSEESEGEEVEGESGESGESGKRKSALQGKALL